MRRKDREITEQSEITNILDRCPVCRLGLLDQGTIYLVPLNYGYAWQQDGLMLYFHSAPTGRKLDLISTNPQVAFEMDCNHELITAATACEHGYRYESISGNGMASILTDTTAKKQALQQLLRHMTGQEAPIEDKILDHTVVFQVKVENLTCKRHL